MSEANESIWMIVGTPTVKGIKGYTDFTGTLLHDDEEPEDSSSECEGRVSLNVEALKTKTHEFMQVVGDIFASADREAQKEGSPGMKLEEIQLSVGLDAEGEIGFWGVGKANVTGATEIKLTFKRKDS